jgi:hypothetical protein
LNAQPALIQILRKPPQPIERCELCGAGIAGDHGHLVNIVSRTILCACRPCYLLFAHEGAGGYRFRAVPTRYQRLPEFGDARDGWEALQIPVGLAFFFKNSVTGRVTAFYPSPAGAMESELSLDAWTALVETVPPLASMLPDVEALIVRREAGEGSAPTASEAMKAMLAPIDACYELVGRIRKAWRGMQGGDEVGHEIDAFFTRAAC